MSPTLRVFGVAIQTHPFALLLAVWMGLWLSEWAARKLGLDGNRLTSLGLYALLATVVGARLSYVIAHWSAYRDAPLSILSLTPTALSWPGGMLFGGIVVLVLWRRHRLPAGITLDAVTPGLTLALAVEQLGAFLGGNGLGTLTTLPWGVYVGDAIRHPVQLYEMVALLVILGILLWRQERRPFEGHSFALFVALYAGARLFLEAFRDQTPIFLGGMRTIQVGALATMMGALWYLYRRRFPPARGTAGTGPEEDLGNATL